MACLSCGADDAQSLVNVDVYCGSDKPSVKGLLDELNKMYELGRIGEVTFVPLPYNVKEMNATEFRKRPQKHFMLLCHSINNRGFSITDVTNSLYDDYLKNVKSKLEQKMVGVIAYDFPANEVMGENLKNRMEAFRRNQKSTFEYSCFATVAANLNTDPVGLSDGQLNELVEKIQISSLSSKKRQEREKRGENPVKSQPEAPQAPVEQGNEAPQSNAPKEIEPKQISKE